MRKFGWFLLAFALAPASAGVPPPFVRSFLHDRIGFSTHDLADLADGRPVAKLIPTDNAVDVSVCGAVRIAVPPEAFIAQLRNIESYERRLGVIAAGKFSEPATAADLATLTIDDPDAIRECRPGDCELQLSSADMARFREDATVPGPAGRARTTADFREMLPGVIRRYRDGGLAALGTYDDRKVPLSLAKEFAALDVGRAIPPELTTLVQQVLDDHAAAPADGEDFYYWNKGQFGMKATTRVNRVTILPIAGAGERPDGLRYAVSTIQLYSSHYFSATFELRTIVDDNLHPGKAFYLIYTSRSRVSGLTGFLGSFIRPIAKGRARSGMERYLLNTRKAVEAAYAGAPETPPS